MGDTKTLETARGVTRRERATGVGARVREARLEIGLTQGELGGSRFSKEYVSQVELGKTRPSPAALDWFAERLGVDRMALAGESSAAIMAACEAAVTRAEAEIEAHRDAEALAELEGVRDARWSPRGRRRSRLDRATPSRWPSTGSGSSGTRWVAWRQRHRCWTRRCEPARPPSTRRMRCGRASSTREPRSGGARRTSRQRPRMSSRRWSWRTR